MLLCQTDYGPVLNELSELLMSTLAWTIPIKQFRRVIKGNLRLQQHSVHYNRTIKYKHSKQGLALSCSAFAVTYHIAADTLTHLYSYNRPSYSMSVSSLQRNDSHFMWM